MFVFKPDCYDLSNPNNDYYIKYHVWGFYLHFEKKNFSINLPDVSSTCTFNFSRRSNYDQGCEGMKNEAVAMVDDSERPTVQPCKY